MTMQPRLSAQLCDAIDDVDDELDAAMADGIVDLTEVRAIKNRLAEAGEIAADADEAAALTVALFRRGADSPRFNRLWRERQSRLSDDPRPAA